MNDTEYVELSWTPELRGAVAVVLQRLVRRPPETEVDAIGRRLEQKDNSQIWKDLKVLVCAAIWKLADDTYWHLVAKRQWRKICCTPGIKILKAELLKNGWKEWQDGNKETSKNPVFRVFEIESYSQSYLISHRFVGANLIC